MDKLRQRLQLLRSHGPAMVALVNLLEYLIGKVEEVEKQVGPEGPEGKQGEQGLEGPQGPKGDKGEPGESIVGPKGERGPQGPIGPQGKAGKDGKDGRDGKDGKDGIDGTDGLDGKDGSPDTPQEVRDKLASLQGSERLDARYIKNIPETIREVRTRSVFGGGKSLEVPGAGQDIRKIVFSGATVSRIGDGVAQVASTSGVGVTTTTSTASPTDTTGFVVLLCNCTGGNVTVNLPTAVGNIARFTVKKVDSSANTVTIDGSGVETIDGGTTATLKYQYESVDLVSDNSNWLVI